MPEIRRRNLPPALLDHLLDRVRLREISPEQLGEFAQWLDTAPKVPTGKWFKRFTGPVICPGAFSCSAFHSLIILLS